MKKIYQLALANATITKENVLALIDAMEERFQENAILLVTGNYTVPDNCVKGFNIEVTLDDEKVVATVEKSSILDQEVKIAWTDKNKMSRHRYFSYQHWNEFIKKSK